MPGRGHSSGLHWISEPVGRPFRVLTCWEKLQLLKSRARRWFIDYYCKYTPTISDRVMKQHSRAAFHCRRTQAYAAR